MSLLVVQRPLPSATVRGPGLVAPVQLDPIEQDALFRSMVDAALDGVVCVDKAGNIVLVNLMMESIFGFASAELIGESLARLIPDYLHPSHQRSGHEVALTERARPVGVVSGLNGVRKNGDMFPVDVSFGVSTHANSGYAVGFVRDVSERYLHEEMMVHQATHDRLTGLPNRWLFLDRLRQSIATARREDSRVAVLMLDLDNFKTVNDSFGDAFGDEVLLEVSARIRGLLREEDTLARLGGDEFGILLSSMERTDEAIHVAEKILLSFAAPCKVNKQAVIVGGSLGISFFPEDGADGETLLRFADVAMYQAKSSGRGVHVTFSGAMDRRLQEDLQLHVRLKHALDVGGLVLHYQPQVDTQTGAIVGCEALLRWCDEEIGNVSPARFIPLAESTGLILPIGDWVIDTACKQIATWTKAGTPLRVAVNLSARQLRDKNVVDKIRRALDRAGARAELLEIEITETAVMENLELAQQLLVSLGSLGIGVSLDDFGTGYSSLGALKNIPISKLKIDQSFVANLPSDVNDVALVRTIISLAKNLNLKLVAEGVETDAQRAFLQHAGCETYQGWLFSKAVVAAEMEKMLLKSVGSGESGDASGAKKVAYPLQAYPGSPLTRPKLEAQIKLQPVEISALVYVSSAAKHLDDGEFLELLVDARAFNSRAGLTGVLLHHDGSFFQYIEGPSNSLAEAYERIKSSRKHQGLMELDYRKIERRQFTQWNMGFAEAPNTLLLELANAQWLRTVSVLEASPAQSDGLALLLGFWSTCK